MLPSMHLGVERRSAETGIIKNRNEGITSEPRALDRETDVLLVSLSYWSAEQLFTQPTPQQWSAAHVLRHLLGVERTTMASIHSNLAHPPTICAEHRPTRLSSKDCERKSDFPANLTQESAITRH
jgi:hypothetical protein